MTSTHGFIEIPNNLQELLYILARLSYIKTEQGIYYLYLLNFKDKLWYIDSAVVYLSFVYDIEVLWPWHFIDISSKFIHDVTEMFSVALDWNGPMISWTFTKMFIEFSSIY